MRLTRASHWNNSRIKTRKTDEENEFVLENPFYKIESIQLHSSRKTNEFTQLDRYESNEKRQRAKWNYWFWFVPLESFNFVPFLAGRGDSTATETPTHSRFPFPWNPPKCRKSFISFFLFFSRHWFAHVCFNFNSLLYSHMRHPIGAVFRVSKRRFDQVFDFSI